MNGKRVMIVGKGVSGQGAREALELSGAESFFYNGAEDFTKGIDLIVVSPGVPMTHEVFSLAEEKGIPVIGEIELGYILCSQPVIAVTGTNGKTTITELIGRILSCDKRTPLVCGNIGLSFSAAAVKAWYDIAVVEVSSFQLETISRFRPKVAIISNITEDHLDRHKTMEGYAKAKLRIAMNQTESDYLVITPEVGKFMSGESVMAKIRYADYCLDGEGCYIIDNILYYNGAAIVHTDGISIKGRHNHINAMLAVSACKLVGVSDNAIREGLRLFWPRAYRMAFSGEHMGKKYYNDSKGTNIDACLCACRAVSGDTCLIAGGSDKGYDFDKLFINLPGHIVKIYAVGETRDKIFASAVRTGYPSIERAASIREAVYKASELNVANVLLSPAAASFDSYSNYEERGRDFDNIVAEITGGGLLS